MNNMIRKTRNYTLSITVVVLGLNLTGCGSMAKNLFSDTASGINRTTSSSINETVVNTHREAANLSAKNISIASRSVNEVNQEKAELALKGAARSIKGLSIIDTELHMIKTTYSDGYLLLNKRGIEEKWNILAFEKRGDYDSEFFEFTYLLSNESNEVCSLIILGNKFKLKNRNYLAYEGTLIFPGQNTDWKHYKDAYKIDYGYQIPETTVFETSIKTAILQSNEISSQLKRMKEIRTKIDEKKSSLDDLMSSMKTSNNRDQLAIEIDLIKIEIESLNNEITNINPGIEHTTIELMNTRGNIANHFSEFAMSNQYTWLPKEDQVRFYNKWESVNSLDKDIDTYMRELPQFISYFGKLKYAHERMTSEIQRFKNAEKNPVKTK